MLKGRISQWRDDKGFGFITPDDRSDQVFFHISSVKKAARKPVIGDEVTFERSKDAQGRLRATHVLLAGVSLARPGYSQHIVTEPVKKDLLDYGGYLVSSVMAIAAIVMGVTSGNVDAAILLGALVLGVLFVLSLRKKKPTNPRFSCAKCRTVAQHDARTVQAWNRGLSRLYCRPCHLKWLRERPNQQPDPRASSPAKSGCLGVFIAMAAVPLLALLGIISNLI